jgi:SAM-dependent methyltransferase
MQLSTDRILGKVAQLAAPHLHAATRHLDIGSGTGALIGLLRARQPALQSSACDYTEVLMQLPGQAVDVADLNAGGLPYGEGAFSLVTCTEVVEHLENFRHAVREIHRVLAPGGVAILTTPNVLNLQSRLRFLGFGFWNLFGPLPVQRSERFSTAGHITPVPYFYLAHALAEAGLTVQGFHTDKFQRTAMPKMLLWWPWIALASRVSAARERSRYRTVDASNAPFVAAMNSMQMLLGRTLVVLAHKPA